MKLKFVALVCSALVSAVGFSSSAMAGSIALTFQTFSIPNDGNNDGTGDFGICCSSPPATSPDVQLGSTLGPDGLPIAGAGSNVVDITPTLAGNEIDWWGPLAVANYGFSNTGGYTANTPYSSNMFPPNSTGSSDDGAYETAIITGSLTSDFNDLMITVAADDDALVFVNGKYVGGTPGVHGTSSTSIFIPGFGGTGSLEIFYADRARVGANLSLNVTNVPEPLTLSIFGAALAGAAAAARRRRKADKTA